MTLQNRELQGAFVCTRKGRVMPRKADPDRKKAFEIYKESRGNTDLVEIAKQLNRPPGNIRGWKTFRPKVDIASRFYEI